MRRGAWRFLAPLLLTGALGACEDASGPGVIEAAVENPRRLAGAALVEITGVGVQDVQAVGPVRVFWSATDRTGVIRVIVSTPDADTPLRFTLSVADVSAPAPSAQVVAATSLANDPIANLEGFTVALAPPTQR